MYLNTQIADRAPAMKAIHRRGTDAQRVFYSVRYLGDGWLGVSLKGASKISLVPGPSEKTELVRRRRV